MERGERAQWGREEVVGQAGPRPGRVQHHLTVPHVHHTVPHEQLHFPWALKNDFPERMGEWVPLMKGEGERDIRSPPVRYDPGTVTVTSSLNGVLWRLERERGLTQSTLLYY